MLGFSCGNNTDLLRRRKMFKLVEVLFNYNDSGLENICRISDKSWIEKNVK